MSEEGFPPRNRLLTSRDFRGVFKSGRIFHAAHLSIIYRRSPSGCARVGIAIRKTVCCAAKRNRLKRWIRESFRRNGRFRELSLDFVVIVKEWTPGLRYEDIRYDLDRFARERL